MLRVGNMALDGIAECRFCGKVFEQIEGGPLTVCCEACHREHQATMKAERDTQSANRNLQFRFFYADKAYTRPTKDVKESPSVNGLVARE